MGSLLWLKCLFSKLVRCFANAWALFNETILYLIQLKQKWTFGFSQPSGALSSTACNQSCYTSFGAGNSHMSDKFTGQTKELTMHFVLSSAQHWPKYVNFLLQLVNSSVVLHICSLYLSIVGCHEGSKWVLQSCCKAMYSSWVIHGKKRPWSKHAWLFALSRHFLPVRAVFHIRNKLFISRPLFVA